MGLGTGELMSPSCSLLPGLREVLELMTEQAESPQMTQSGQLIALGSPGSSSPCGGIQGWGHHALCGLGVLVHAGSTGLGWKVPVAAM